MLLIDSYCSFMLLLWTAHVVRTQSIETWVIWYIDEGFLFGLSTQRINLMNLQSELVQLVLFTFTPNILFDVTFTWLCVPMFTTQFSMHALFIQIYRYTCTWFRIYYWFSDFCLCFWSLLVPVCLNHITWSCTRVIAWARQLALAYVLVGLLSDNPGPSCLDSRVWTVVDLS